MSATAKIERPRGTHDILPSEQPLWRTAVGEAERCTRWWRENRPAAPELFESELRAALDRIRTAPLSGSAYEVMRGRGPAL